MSLRYGKWPDYLQNDMKDMNWKHKTRCQWRHSLMFRSGEYKTLLSKTNTTEAEVKEYFKASGSEMRIITPVPQEKDSLNEIQHCHTVKCACRKAFQPGQSRTHPKEEQAVF